MSGWAFEPVEQVACIEDGGEAGELLHGVTVVMVAGRGRLCGQCDAAPLTFAETVSLPLSPERAER